MSIRCGKDVAPLHETLMKYKAHLSHSLGRKFFTPIIILVNLPSGFGIVFEFKFIAVSGGGGMKLTVKCPGKLESEFVYGCVTIGGME
ncbi:hypothetical protein PoB_001479400 [Plakobranchus ocellatus]|uniref:Uncharacterized protein n=1 Tax=Plakobranchus ocellatus TaxID=259542 RepID=A0AAV3YZ32_9GAST|nr:hypothetical protein PoB_001479400 [Plakobranchus ocellatus]